MQHAILTKHLLTDINPKVTRIEYFGALTNTSGAIRLTEEAVFDSTRGDRPDAVNIAIVVTDGNSNIEQEQTQYQSELLQQEAWVIAVGISSQVRDT